MFLKEEVAVELGNVCKYCIEIFVNKQARRLGITFSPLGIHQP